MAINTITNQPRLGVDIGGVIISTQENGPEDTSFFCDNYLRTPEVEGAFGALAKLNETLFKGSIFLVSKALERTEKCSIHWLEERSFTQETGIPMENIFFTDTRLGKVAIAEYLGLTHFVDDTVEVLNHLRGHVANLVLMNETLHLVEDIETLEDCVPRVSNWEETGAVLLGQPAVVEYQAA